MAGKMKKIILRTLAGILIFVLLILAAAYMFLKFYIMPKYNAALGDDVAQSERLTEKDILGFAKNFANKQVIENIVNFDKDSAKDLLQTAKEIEAEKPTEEPKAEAESIVPPKALWSANITKKTDGISRKSAVKKEDWSPKIAAKVDAIPTPTPKPTPKPTPAPKATAVPKKNEVKGATAYERIMNAATKSEISAGMAILAKVNMGKVNQLRSQGKMGELKKYITSVLTSAEISKALQLYGKYKHLL